MFLDIGLGIIAALLATGWVNEPLSVGLLVFCIGCALLPDADFIYFYVKWHDTKYDYQHRDLIHYPLVYLPIGTFLFWIILGQVCSLGFLIASLFHFLHDSIAIGWGIKWLYPFSRNQYAFFYLYSVKVPSGLRQCIFIFDRDSLPEYVHLHGDKDWVRNIYGKWHPIAQVEVIGFVVALTILFFYYIR